MRKTTIFVFILLLFVLQSYSFAEVKTFIKEYNYKASTDDSRNASRVTAMREVKRLLFEALETYLESITEVKNFQLTKDQITSLTAVIVKTEIVNEKWDGHTYWIKTKVVADANDVIKSIDNLRKDREKLRELEDIKKRADAILEQNKQLRKELALAKGNAKQEVQQRYDNSIKELSSIEWRESGNRNYYKTDYETAINDFSRAIEINPNYDLAYNDRGATYNKLGKYNEAIVDFNKAIEINPNLDLAYGNRGTTYYILGKYNEAIVDLNKEIELNPKDAIVYNNRGAAYSFLGKYNEAIVDFNKAIELNPNLDLAYSTRGAAYYALGKYNEAIVDLNKAIELNTKDAADYNNRGAVYYALGKYNEAIVDLNKVIELNPNDEMAYSDRGLAYISLGKHSEAIIDLNKAIELNSKIANPYKYRGVSYNKLGKYSEAIIDFNKAIELNPQYADAYYARACSYSMLRNTRNAIAELNKAIQMKPALRNDAKTDRDFDNIKNNPDFKKLIIDHKGIHIESKSENDSIGSAIMEDDGTIVLQLRAEGPNGLIGDSLFRYPPTHPEYNNILRHLGGLKKGESKNVPPWPSK
jgi:tetratricopeptide (TPR) repeat protein